MISIVVSTSLLKKVGAERKLFIGNEKIYVDSPSNKSLNYHNWWCQFCSPLFSFKGNSDFFTSLGSERFDKNCDLAEIRSRKK